MVLQLVFVMTLQHDNERSITFRHVNFQIFIPTILIHTLSTNFSSLHLFRSLPKSDVWIAGVCAILLLLFDSWDQCSSLIPQHKHTMNNCPINRRGKPT